MSDKYLHSSRQQLVNAVGTESCWGWSPAIDFVELLQRHVACGAAASSSSQEQTSKPVVNGTVTRTTCDDVTAPSIVPSGKSDIDDLLAELNLRKAKVKPPSAGGDEIGQDGEVASVVDEAARAATDADEPAEVHILLAGACDIRHIFRTMASLRLREAASRAMDNKDDDDERGKEHTQHAVPHSCACGSAAAPLPTRRLPRYVFYLYEPNLCLHGRHLFLLQWLWDSMFALEELEERVLMFLDVYGNACTRDVTAAQIRRVVQHLLHGLQSAEDDTTSSGRDDTKSGNGTSHAAVGCAEVRPEFASTVCFSEMKLKERDFVEQQLTHWARDTSHADIEAQWSRRVRTELAERYDNRDNIIDWDYVFKLTDYTRLLRFPEYRAWRNGGVAFDVTHINPRRGFSYVYTMPNKTLCFFDRRGNGTYSGDVTCGPFTALGCTTENRALHACHPDGTCRYGCGIVAMHNIRAWLYALMTATSWPWCDHAFAWDDDAHYNILPPRNGRSAATGPSAHTRRGNATEGDAEDDDEEAHAAAEPQRYYACFPRVQFRPVTLQFDRLLRHVGEGKLPRFDAAFVGTSCTHLMTPEFFSQAMSPSGVVVAETVKFVVAAEEAVKVAYVNKVEELGAAAGWQRAAGLTAWLHEGQPASTAAADSTMAGLEGSKGQERLSEAQRMAQARYAMPFQIALTRATAAAQ